MPGTVVEQAACQECGAAVRENTIFCYSCGTRLAPDDVKEADTIPENGVGDARDDTRAALDELAVKLKADETDDDKLAKAAAQRKKARVRRHRPKEVVWEPIDDSANGIIVVVAVLTALAAGVIVLFTVVWR